MKPQPTRVQVTHQEQAAAVPPPSTALVTTDELAGLSLFDGERQLADDGLSEVSSEDMKIAAKVLNFKGTDPKTGRKIPEDAYYDTVDETVTDHIDAAFLHLHKTNLYSSFNKTENRNDIVCRSFDRVTGTMQDGTERPCQGCPDAAWHTEEDEEGKRTRTRNCGPVYNMFAIDRTTHLPFVIRFKRTGLPVLKSYLQKYFIGRRMVGGKRLNYPLFAFGTAVSCKMSDNGKYALPVLTRGGLFTEDEIRAHADAQKFLRENMLGLLDKVEAQAESKESAPDTSFDPEKFTADEGKDFVDGPSAA